MRAFLSLVLFLIVCAGLFALGSAQSGVPITGLYLATAAAPDTTSLGARQATAEARSTQSAGEAQYLAGAQKQTRQAYADQLARQTAQAQAETAAVNQQQTAAAWQVTVVAAHVQETATARAVATQAVATQAAVQVTQTADIIKLQAVAGQATQIARDNENRAARAQIDLQVKSSTRYWWVLAAAFFLGAGGFFGYRFLRIREDTAARPVPVDPATGRAAPMVIKGQVVSMDLSRVPVQDPRHPIQAVDGEQLEIVHRDQTVRAVYGSNRIGARQPASRGPIPANFPIEQPPSNDLPEVAPWDALASWTGKNFPLGIGPNRTGISLNPETTPNLIVIGTSNSGKTMMGLRVMATEALASSWQVILMNDAAGDFAPLKTHPNLVMVDGKAPEIVDTLATVLQEVERRQRFLKAADISTYYRFGNAQEQIGPRVMVILDELTALAQSAASDSLSKRLWRALIEITSQCRKTGIMVVLGTTNPTGRLGDDFLTVRDNCGRMVFRVRDMAVSRAALDINGAEELTGCQFIAQLDAKPIKGVAFHPEDEDIVRFLAARPAEQLPAPRFLTAKAGESAAAVDSRDQRIRDLSAQGKSLNEIQREVFGFTGGAAYTAVKAVLGDGASTTTTDSPSTTAPAPAV